MRLRDSSLTAKRQRPNFARRNWNSAPSTYTVRGALFVPLTAVAQVTGWLPHPSRG